MSDASGAAESSPRPGASPNRPPTSRRLLAWVFALLPVLIVLGVAAGYWFWGPGSRGSTTQVNQPALAEPQTPRVKHGRDYYVFIKTIEAYPQRPDGKAWDRITGSAPDLRYSLSWQGLVVYTSPEREDTLIGVWDPISVDVRSALPLLGDGKLELASTLNQGAIVHVQPEQTLTINVWDQDLPGMGSDPVGEVVLTLDQLLDGDNVLTFEASEHNAIKRIVLGLTDTSQPAKNLLEALQAQ